MARYGVNIVPEKPAESLAEAQEESSGSAKERARPAMLVTLYALAVAVTPEFNFLGIPKVRITDLLIPLLLINFGSNLKYKPGSRKSYFGPMCTSLIIWDLGALFVWGQATPNPGLFYVAKRAIYFLVALLCSASVQNVKAWNQVIRTLVFASPILNCSVLLEMFAYNTRPGSSDAENIRASGIIANQQTSTALFIVIVCCLSLGAWDAYKDRLWRLGTCLALLTGVGAIFATGSRGGMACAGLSLVFTVILRPGSTLPLVLIGSVVGGVGWMLTPAPLQERLINIFPETQATVAGLVNPELMPDTGSSSIAGRAVSAKWFFTYLMPLSGLLGLGAGWRKLGVLDNFYLTEWLYHGFIGLCLFLRLQIALLAYCLAAVGKAKDPVEKGVATGVAVAVMVMSASGIHGDTFYLIRPMECLALLVGLVIARRSWS